MNIVILGFDGMEPDLVDKMDLPTFGNLKEEGKYSTVDSTLLPLSPMAWSNFLTGRRAGSHNIFDFTICEDKKKGKFRFTQPGDRKGPEMWHLLGKRDLKVGVVGVPLTYPPTGDCEFMVSGYPTPDPDKGVLPDNLTGKAEIDNSDLFPKVHFDGTNSDEVVSNQMRQWKAIEGLYEDILEQDELWDVLVVVFKQTDDVAHIEWGGESLRDLYKRADRLFQRTSERLTEMDEEYLLFGVSDHGFGPVEKTLFLNNILMKEGFLTLSNTLPVRMRKAMNRIGVNTLNGYRLAAKLGFGESLVSAGLDEESLLGMAASFGRDAVFLSQSDIDYQKSDCYSRGNYGQIFLLNEGVKSRIIDTLEGYTIDGTEVIESVHDTDEVFPNRNRERTPDLVVETPNYDYLTSRGFSLGSNKILTDHVIGREAEHKETGVFFAEGSGLESIKNDEVNLEDILPTIFSALGEEIPGVVEGEPISLSGIDQVTKRRQDSWSEGGITSEIPDSEEKEIEERLKSLGYSAE